MADSTTTNYGWAYPTVNADADTWGTTLNNAIIAADAALHTVDVAGCKKANNLSDVTASTARTNLGLGTAATHAATDFLTPSTGLQVSNNLSDVTAATARGNLGLGSMATRNITVSSSGPTGSGGTGDLWIQT